MSRATPWRRCHFDRLVSFGQPPAGHPFGERLGLLAGHLIAVGEELRARLLAHPRSSGRAAPPTPPRPHRRCSTCARAAAQAGNPARRRATSKNVEPVDAGSSPRIGRPIRRRCRRPSPCAATARSGLWRPRGRGRKSPRPRSDIATRPGRPRKSVDRAIHHPHRARAIFSDADLRHAAATSPNPIRPHQK